VYGIVGDEDEGGAAAASNLPPNRLSSERLTPLEVLIREFPKCEIDVLQSVLTTNDGDLAAARSFLLE
jgi:hypothetical protein